METPSLLSVNPILPAFDMPATIDFWRRMGFNNIYDSTNYGDHPINYAVMRRDDLCVHLQYFKDIEDQYTPQLRFEVKGVAILLEEFKSNDLLEQSIELRTTRWDTKEFGLFDPNKVGITFFESMAG